MHRKLEIKALRYNTAVYSLSAPSSPGNIIVLFIYVRVHEKPKEIFFFCKKPL